MSETLKAYRCPVHGPIPESCIVDNTSLGKRWCNIALGVDESCGLHVEDVGVLVHMAEEPKLCQSRNGDLICGKTYGHAGVHSTAGIAGGGVWS